MAAPGLETEEPKTRELSPTPVAVGRRREGLGDSKLRGLAVEMHLRIGRLFFGNRPVPLRYWLGLKSLLGGLCSDVLAPAPSKGALKTKKLKQLIPSEQYGRWALDAPTLELIWEKLLQEQPRLIIECGAGTSTILFAKYASTNENVRIISLEQRADTKAEVERRLVERGANPRVQILHSPLSHDSEYQFDREEIRRLTQPGGADWIFIDGPAGPEGCRTHTLLVLARYCRPGARWFLDDAFRDGELETLQSWSQTAGLVVDGIYPLGKGFATGTVAQPDQVR